MTLVFDLQLNPWTHVFNVNLREELGFPGASVAQFEFLWENFHCFGARHDIAGTKIKSIYWGWLVYAHKLKRLFVLINGLGNITDSDLLRLLSYNS